MSKSDFIVIDPLSSLGFNGPDTSKIPEAFFEKLRALVAKSEIFLCEAPYNNYTPSPPEGYIALRSQKRRLFVPDKDCRVNLSELIQSGAAIELPLT